MTVLANTITTADVASALDIEMVSKFDTEFSKLRELMGVYSVERVAAGTAIYQYSVDGTLPNTAPVDEGEEVPLTKYTVEKKHIGDMTLMPFRKLTTAQAILKGGFVGAVLRTDEKMIAQLRNFLVASFINGLDSTDIATASATGLQEAIALAGAKVLDNMETNGDAASGLVYFISRTDAAKYLAKAPVTTQNVFGMTYLENFLGAERVFISANIPAGTVYVTAPENIHVYAIDWNALSNSGLDYYVSEDGLIGVHHDGNYARTSSETNVLSGVLMYPEVENYICKATITYTEG